MRPALRDCATGVFTPRASIPLTSRIDLPAYFVVLSPRVKLGPERFFPAQHNPPSNIYARLLGTNDMNSDRSSLL